MDINKDDVYANIFVPCEIPHREIGELLRRYVRIDDTFRVLFIHDLTVQRKIILYLLALHALKYLGKRETDSERPREIARQTRMNHNTVRVELRNLLADKLIMQQRGRYSIDVMQVCKAMQCVSGA